MVKTLTRCLALFGLILPLASCIFFASAFPPTLTQVVARTDLSTVIPPGSDSNYEVYCVTATAAPPGDFVLLMNRTFSGDPVVVVLDSGLNLIQTYTLLQLQGWGAFSGNWIMADALGNVEIGSFGFSPDELRTVGQSPSSTGHPPISGPSFCSPAAGRNDVDFRVEGGNTLKYNDYFAGWAPHFPASVDIKGTPDVQFEVAGVYNVDDASAGGSVILVLDEQNSSTIHFVAIPRSDILAIGGVQTPILDKYPTASYNNVDAFSIGFAGDCLAAYSSDSHALVRYQLTSPFGEIDKLPVGQSPHPLAYAWKADGSYSVQFDQTTRIITKVAKWW